MKKLIILLALIWVTKSFGSIDAMTNFMNTLTTERALEAKIFVTASFRPYYIMYRDEIS